ncbi:MAG: hypothetical protein GY903_10220 [Fuerstiella sp.]|nr:hypothetical protein [Fuerstiella sp.]MCP4854853.1 hypothetical protein [Fuerstiella sp.]
MKIDPMKGYPIPSPGKRVAPFTDEDLAELYAATDDYYADFVKLGSLTGLRSYCELAEITAENMIVSDRGVQLSVSGKMLSGSREKIRIFPLLKEAAEMCLRLAETAPKGSGIPLLRNSKGGKWSRGAAIERMAKLRKKLKWCDDSRKQHLVNYSSRDYFAHGMISGSLTPNRKGVSLEVLAEMMEILQVCSQNTMCRCGAPITMSLCGRRSDSSYFA